MVWDVEGGKKTSGSNIQQYAWNGTGAQIFKVIETEENGEKIYQFIGKASRLTTPALWRKPVQMSVSIRRTVLPVRNGT